jgi:hypothetical protein
MGSRPRAWDRDRARMRRMFALILATNVELAATLATAATT